ncbi:MAG: TolC family protein [Leptospirales bacterium]
MSTLLIFAASPLSGESPSKDLSPSGSPAGPSRYGSVGYRPTWLFALIVLSGILQGILPFGGSLVSPAQAESLTRPPASPAPDRNLPVLTLDQAIRIALDRNPALARERALVGREKARSVQSGELPDPKLVLGEQYFPISLNMGASLLTMTTVGLRQGFSPWGKRDLLHQRSLREEKAALWNLEDRKIRLVQELRLSWIDLYRNTRTETMLRAIGALWQKAFESALTRYRQGTGSESDLLRTQFQKDNIKDRQESLRIQKEKILHRLMRLMPLSHPFRISEEEPRLPVPPSESVLLDRINRHPALQSRSAREGAQAIGVQAAKKDKIPAFSVEGDYSYFMGPSLITSTPNLFSVVLTMNLPVRPGERQDQKVREEEQTLQSVRAQHEELRQRLIEEIRNAENDYRHLSHRVVFLDAVLLPEAQRNAQVAMSGYATGSSGLNPVLEAMGKVEEISIRSLDLQADRMKSMANLSYLDGALPGGSDEP